VDSYLSGTFLGDLSDEFGDDLSADGATMALTPATGERQVEYITLPGGIMMEKKSFYIVVGILAAIAIYLATRKKK
jgi:hypothetical protein